MKGQIFLINKHVQKPLRFCGLTGQYILYLCAGLVLHFLAFAFLYMTGCNAILCTGIILPAGTGFWFLLIRLHKQYGSNGMLKKIAQQKLPACVKCNSAKMFFLSGK